MAAISNLLAKFVVLPNFSKDRMVVKENAIGLQSGNNSLMASFSFINNQQLNQQLIETLDSKASD